MDTYVIQRNTRDPELWDVVRNAPTVISSELKHVEADALAFALNVQLKLIEGRDPTKQKGMHNENS